MSVKKVLIVCLLMPCLNVSYAQKMLSAETLQKAESVRPLADSVKKMAERLTKTGFTARDGEVWIRDMNTFIEVSCSRVKDKAVIKNI